MTLILEISSSRRITWNIVVGGGGGRRTNFSASNIGRGMSRELSMGLGHGGEWGSTAKPILFPYLGACIHYSSFLISLILFFHSCVLSFFLYVNSESAIFFLVSLSAFIFPHFFFSLWENTLFPHTDNRSIEMAPIALQSTFLTLDPSLRLRRQRGISFI